MNCEKCDVRLDKSHSSITSIEKLGGYLIGIVNHRKKRKMMRKRRRKMVIYLNTTLANGMILRQQKKGNCIYNYIIICCKHYYECLPFSTNGSTTSSEAQRSR